MTILLQFKTGLLLCTHVFGHPFWITPLYITSNFMRFTAKVWELSIICYEIEMFGNWVGLWHCRRAFLMDWLAYSNLDAFIHHHKSYEPPSPPSPVPPSSFLKLHLCWICLYTECSASKTKWCQTPCSLRILSPSRSVLLLVVCLAAAL